MTFVNIRCGSLADGISIPELDQLKRYAKYLEGESKNFLRHSIYAMAQFDKELKEVKEKIEKTEEEENEKRNHKHVSTI